VRFIWLHPVVLGAFALGIGMTPFVLVFEYSIDVPGYWFPVGTAVAAASWLWLRRKRIRAMIAIVVILSGGVLTGYGLVNFVMASVHYNVGMAGEYPPEWYSWVPPATRVGEVGLVLLSAGVLAWATVTDSKLIWQIVLSRPRGSVTCELLLARMAGRATMRGPGTSG
jgi:hypothetical protein